MNFLVLAYKIELPIGMSRCSVKWHRGSLYQQQNLFFLGIPEAISVDSDDELLESVYGPDVLKSPEAALMHYRNEHCEINKPSQLLRLSRLAGENDLRRDINFWVVQKPQHSHASNFKSAV